jgi:hypothetical protein
MLSHAATVASSMSKAGLDNRHSNHDGEISHKHGNTPIRALPKDLPTGLRSLKALARRSGCRS